MQSYTALDITWLLLCAFLVMLMQAGFCLLEAGLVRSKNNINVAFKNLSDFAIAALVYWCVGYGLMFGTSLAGFAGVSEFFYEPTSNNAAWFLFQLMFCGATATIVGGALAERTSFSAYLYISVLIGGILYPIPGHWVWGSDEGWLNVMGFIDFAGGAVVHGLGGSLALVAVLIVGPRLGRFPASDSESKNHCGINAANYPLATIGVLLLWFGWFGFNVGSLGGYSDKLAQVAINTVLAAASGCVALILWFLFRTRKPQMSAVLNGTLAGLVGVTAGANLYSATDAVLVGCIGAALMQLAIYQLERFKIDDVIGAFPVHAVAGFAGTLLVAILGDAASFPNGHSPLQQFGVQLLGVLVILAWSLAAGYGLFYLLNRVTPLRVSATAELEGLNFSEHEATTEVQDLLGSMIKQRHSGDFESNVDVEPHTEVGQIADEYNKVLERIRLEIKTREQAYAQLKEASHFQYIFENSNEGIVQFSLEGDVQKANASAASLLGFASVERLTKGVGPFFSDLEFCNQLEHASLLKSFEKQGQIINTEICFKREVDQKRAFALLTLRRISGNKDQRECYLASLVDTNDRKENEKLKVATETAEAANEAKSQFLANMSHEIRTPLNGVTGMLELLSRSDLQQDQTKYVEIAQNSAQSLLSVINDVLDFSKIEAGKLELERVEFLLPEIISDVVDIFAMQTAKKNIELIGYVPSDIPSCVIGDPERLRQILINLLGNAVKFTEQGSISLLARCIKRTEKVAVITIEIKDTGCGISQSNLDKLFQSFTQADSSTTRKFGGTGLGLTISRQLIELMRGKINVKSKLGEGSTFTIDLPFPLSEKIEPDKSILPASLQGLRVLLVDDHPVNLKITKDLLEPFGLQIDCAESADIALDLYSQATASDKPYGLYLLDYHMQGVNGIDLAAQLRAFPSGGNVKMILLTSIDQISRTDDRLANFDARLVKPVRTSRLFDAIADVMSQHFVTDAKADKAKTLQAGSVQPDKELASKKRILIVEDNMVNQIVASEILEQAGYQIATADNGQEGVDMLAQQAFDLVLMDCQMPVLDGFAATRKIRENEGTIAESGNSKLPIIALTANALKGDRERCLAAGMDAYITKPIDPEALYSLISKYLFDDLNDNLESRATGS